MSEKYSEGQDSKFLKKFEFTSENDIQTIKVLVIREHTGVMSILKDTLDPTLIVYKICLLLNFDERRYKSNGPIKKRL